jgi:hypothetical protein
MLKFLYGIRKKRRAASTGYPPRGRHYLRLEGLEQRTLLHGIAAAAGPATHLALIAPENVAVGTAATLEVVAVDASNHLARGYTGTVHFSTTDPSANAALPADYTFSANDRGFHFFQTTLVTAGSESVTGTDTTTSSITGSVTVTVNPAPVVTHFGLFAPRQVVVGQATSVEVVALDAANHRVSDYTGTVQVNVSDPTNATVAPTSYPFTAADHGEHVFQVTLTAAGNEVVTATDTTSTGSITLAVTPAPVATHLGLYVPEYAAAGQPTTVEVVALDASNHPVPGYTGTVQFTGGGAAAILPSSYTFSASDQGHHRFQVTFAAVGSDSLTTTDNSTPALTSTVTLTVNPAPVATHFAVIVRANVVTGRPVGVVVVALDAANHPVPGYTGTVHFGSDDTAATLPADYTFTANDHGYHFFQVTFATVGSETLTVTDTTIGTLLGTSTVNVQTPSSTPWGGGGTPWGGGWHLGSLNPAHLDAIYSGLGGGGHRWHWRH